MKKVFLISLVCTLLLAAGFMIGWFVFVKSPQIQASNLAKQQQEEMQKMTRHGEIVSVSANTITVKIDKSGEGQIGQTVKYHINEYSNIQIGMRFVSQPGQKPDLTKHFKSGEYADLLVKDGQAVLIHRDLRTGEDQPAPQPTERISQQTLSEPPALPSN